MKRPVGEVRLDEQERALIAVWRAFLAWQRERTRFDPSLDEPKPDDDVRLVVHGDGSGSIHIDPEDPNLDEFDAVVFYDLVTGASKIDADRNATEKIRTDREAARARRFGDPRRGRPRARRA